MYLYTPSQHHFVCNFLGLFDCSRIAPSNKFNFFREQGEGATVITLFVQSVFASVVSNFQIHCDTLQLSHVLQPPHCEYNSKLSTRTTRDRIRPRIEGEGVTRKRSDAFCHRGRGHDDGTFGRLRMEKKNSEP